MASTTSSRNLNFSNLYIPPRNSGLSSKPSVPSLTPTSTTTITTATTTTLLHSERIVQPDALGIHRGAIDQTTITTQPPTEVMQKVSEILKDMGVRVDADSAFKYRCIRPRRSATPPSSPSTDDSPSTDLKETKTSPTTQTSGAIYGSSSSQDPGDEVRFSIELTRLLGLNDTYSLDIRRLKGNLRSYKFIYENIRDRAELNQ